MSRWSADDVRRFAARGLEAQGTVNKIVDREVSRLQRAGLLPPKKRAMNKLEGAYAQRLELERLAGVWQWWAFEAIRLRLAEGAWYKPDFAMLDPGGHLVLHETKGHWREAAKVRIKVAAELYPFFRFTAVTRERAKAGGAWQFKAY